MSKYKFIKIFIFIAIFFSFSSFSYAGSDGLNVNLNIGNCNNDGVCDVGEEDFFSCPLDCTPIVVPPTPNPKPNYGGVVGSLVMDNVFNNLTVEVSYNSATIKWQSVIPTMSSLKWGTNPDYRDGVLRNINFLLDHKVVITDLKDGTVYYFNIEAENLLGKTNSLENQVFRTLSLQDTTPPGNPTNVKASSSSSGVTISWDNPNDLDFDYIRVMRNDDRYYGSPFIGHLVYEGNGKYFNDANVKASEKYFYSLFSRDRAGNYSSGSLISIIHNPTGKDTWGDNLTPADNIYPLEYDYIMTQGSAKYDFRIGSIIALSGDQVINIKTNYPSNLKNEDMWVEIKSPSTGILAQYFFSRIKDKDGYLNVEIPLFENSGYYDVNIYKYSSGSNNNTAVLVNRGAFQISKVEPLNNSCFSFCYILWFILLIPLILLVFLLIILIVLIRLIKKH
jgi:hypothetical protein